MAIHIGTSGWAYDHWQGVLYPPGAPLRERLDEHLRRYRTVEINKSYYDWPADGVLSYWRRRLPDAFRLTLKAPMGLTQMRHLARPGAWLARLSAGLGALGDKAGALLVQLAPGFAFDPDRLGDFLRQAGPLARRVAFEFRDPTWHRDETFALLEAHGAAYCVMSGAGLPCLLRATGDFVYVRLHGPDPHALYAGYYSHDDMAWWADRVREWRNLGKEVFVYFNNDRYGNAVWNADTLRGMVGA